MNFGIRGAGAGYTLFFFHPFQSLPVSPVSQSWWSRLDFTVTFFSRRLCNINISSHVMAD